MPNKIVFGEMQSVEPRWHAGHQMDKPFTGKIK
jgi:hypothetical protein